MSIILDKVHFTYSPGNAYEKHAIRNISLKIEDGQFIGIIGHTGSGKSTLIQHLNGLIRAQSGAIYYNGEDIYDKDYDMKKLRQKVGLVFQYPEHQLFETTIFKDVCFGPRNQGLNTKEAELRAFEALRIVGLPQELWYQSPFELSGGQKRRVAIAGVLAMKPEVLILDEPTAGLDPRGRDEILDEFLTFIQDEDHAVLISSHITSDLEKAADYVTYLHRGRVAVQGAKDELLETYGRLACAKADLERVDPALLVGRRVGQFGCEALVKDRRAFCRLYPELTVDRVSLEDIMVFTVKGDVQ